VLQLSLGANMKILSGTFFFERRKQTSRKISSSNKNALLIL